MTAQSATFAFGCRAHLASSARVLRLKRLEPAESWPLSSIPVPTLRMRGALPTVFCTYLMSWRSVEYRAHILGVIGDQRTFPINSGVEDTAAWFEIRVTLLLTCLPAPLPHSLPPYGTGAPILHVTYITAFRPIRKFWCGSRGHPNISFCNLSLCSHDNWETGF
jgi:hypothetical protein